MLKISKILCFFRFHKYTIYGKPKWINYKLGYKNVLRESFFCYRCGKEID